METTNSTAQIIILDLGSQYTLIIAREVSAMGVKVHLLKPNEVNEYLKNNKPKGIILSGGSASVYEDGHPDIPQSIFDSGIPVLGICYGMQFMAHMTDAKAVTPDPHKNKEYGPIEVELEENELFAGTPKKLSAWASHGDVVNFAPSGFKVLAKSANAIQAMAHSEKPWYAVQFHPEVIETKDDNTILNNFVFNISKCIKDWFPENVISDIQKSVTDVATDGKVLIAVSGGVDSMTLASLLSPVLGDRMYAFFINTGGLRKGEAEQVMSNANDANINLHIIDKSDYFFDVLSKTTDAEEKRKVFKNVYKDTIKEIIKNENIKYIMQGTLATDLIESGAAGGSALIKSHHNVNLDFGIEEIMPFGHLFKHEVRDIARQLGLVNVSERQPFPGPGLFIRIVGTPASRELIEIVKEADYIVTNILKEANLYNEISQLIVALLGVQTVGVGGDSRSYKYPIVVRAVSTTDFMTVQGYEIPSETRHKIISKLTSAGLTNRVFFDETPKPPATTEME